MVPFSRSAQMVKPKLGTTSKFASLAKFADTPPFQFAVSPASTYGITVVWKISFPLSFPAVNSNRYGTFVTNDSVRTSLR
jgi:hypothetical protein